MTEMTIFNVQRVITQKSNSTRLTVLVFCRSPHGITQSCKVNKYIIETVVFNVQRPITQKVIKPDMVLVFYMLSLYIFARLKEKIRTHFQVIGRSQV